MRVLIRLQVGGVGLVSPELGSSFGLKMPGDICPGGAAGAGVSLVCGIRDPAHPSAAAACMPPVLRFVDL